MNYSGCTTPAPATVTGAHTLSGSVGNAVPRASGGLCTMAGPMGLYSPDTAHVCVPRTHTHTRTRTRAQKEQLCSYVCVCVTADVCACANEPTAPQCMRSSGSGVRIIFVGELGAKSTECRPASALAHRMCGVEDGAAGLQSVPLCVGLLGGWAVGDVWVVMVAVSGTMR